MKRLYRRMSSVTVSFDLESPILIESGELGARVYLDPSVEAWIDGDSSIDAYIDPNNPNDPLEF